MKSIIVSFVLAMVFSLGAQTINEDIWKYQNDWEVDGAIMLTGFKEDYWPQGTIFVPGEIDGKRVVRLGYDLFYDYDDVKTIVVADSIKYIEGAAFYCEAERIVLPSSMDCSNLYLNWLYCDGSWTETSSIGSYFNMNYLKKIEFSNGKNVSDNGKVFIVDNMLLSVNYIDGIGITTNLLGICGRAYENKCIYVPDGVTGILCQTFEDCGCSEISFPSSLRALGGEFGGGYCFGWNEKPKRVEVRGEGSPYKVIGGSLVDTRTKTLVLATAGTEIPNDDSVESIGVLSFTGSKINKIVIPNNIRTIARSAFMDAWRAQTITVGSGATNIYGGAFTSLYSLKSFYIDEENPIYEVVNGCVVDKRNNRLISPCYGRMTGGVCEVPYFCTSFADSAFKNEYEIATVVLPRNMTHYEYQNHYNEGFASWSDVERVVIADCEDEREMNESTTYNSLVSDYEDWVEHLDYWKGFSYTALPQVAVRCRGRVMAKGFGRYKPGTKVKLTATVADKGFGVRWLDSDGNVVGTKNTLTVVMPDEDVCYTVEPIVGNGAVLKNEIQELVDFDKAVIPVGHCVDGAYGDDPEYECVFDGAVSVKVSGLPTGMSYETKIVPGGIWLKLCGTATKVGVYKVSFVVTYANKTKKTSEKYFVVTEGQGKYIKIFDGSKATEKLYAAGAKVTLAPKGPKGFYFAGWYTSPNFSEENKFTALWDYDDADYRSANFFIRRPGQIDPDALYARFITKEEDSVCEITFSCGEKWTVLPGQDAPIVFVNSETIPKITVKGLPKGISFKNGELIVDELKIWPGVYEADFSAKNLSGYVGTAKLKIVIPNKSTPYLPNLDTAGVYKLPAGVAAAGWLDVTAIDGYETASISGLPPGMQAIKNKYSGEWSVSGVPTKPGDYTITITAKSGKQVVTSTVTVHIDAMPEWAVGTFAGMVGVFDGSIENDDFLPYGTINMTVSANGKLTAKVMMAGRTATFSASGYQHIEGGSYIVDLLSKSGDKLILSISEVEGIVVRGEGEFYNADTDKKYSVFAWRNEHGAKNRLAQDAKAAGAIAAIAKKGTIYLSCCDDNTFKVVQTAKEADVQMKVNGKTGVVTYSGIVDGVKISGSEFLKFDDDHVDYYYVIADLVVYDKKRSKVVYLSMGWDVDVSEGGYSVKEDFEWEVYPFE